MATVFELDSVACSGTLAEVFLQNVEGGGDLGVHVANVGSQALTAAVLDSAPASGGPFALISNTAFATLAASAAERLLVDPAGAKWLRLRATCASGTDLDVVVTNDYESSA